MAAVLTPTRVRGFVELRDGRWATPHQDGLVRLWSWRPTPASIVAVGSLRVWHDYLTTLVELPGGVLAAGCKGDAGTVRLWDVASARCIGGFQLAGEASRCRTASAMAVSREGELVVGQRNGVVSVYAFGWAVRRWAVFGWVAVRAGLWE